MRNNQRMRVLAVALSMSLAVGCINGTNPVRSRAETAGEAVSGGAASGSVTSGAAVGGESLDEENVTGSAISTAAPILTDEELAAYQPAMPGNVTIYGGSKRVRIRWSPVAEADGYCIYSRLSTEAGYAKVATVEGGEKKEYILKNLTQNASYSVVVSAYRVVGNQIAEGKVSRAVSAQTASVPATSKKAKLYPTKKKFTASPAYKKFANIKKYMNESRTFAIPGMIQTNVAGFHCTTMVPQAVCYAGNYLLICAYDYKGVENSVIYIVSKASKSYISTIVLPDNAKVDGMAYDGANVWITKGKKVACFPYSFVEEVIDSGSSYKKLSAYKSVCDVLTTASYMGYYDGILWVGEFSTSKSTLYGYSVTDKDTVPGLMQTRKMAAPVKVQGIAFGSDGTLILTQSYRTNSSKSGYISRIKTYLPSYANVAEDGTVKKNAARKTSKMPPMAGGVTVYGAYTYAVFSSSYYKSCQYPVDRVIAMKTTQLV